MYVIIHRKPNINTPQALKPTILVIYYKNNFLY